MDLKRLDWILVKAQEMDLTSWEEKFIRDLTNRREKYEDRIVISVNQEEVLERIADKG